MNIEDVRKWYAEEVRYQADITLEDIVKAFAKVPREHFLGKGPWKIRTNFGYRMTADDNPFHLYHNILVAIDATCELNNGLPSWLARMFQAATPTSGETITHIGCGTGYYSAILAEIVGSSGSIVALEIDEYLAQRATQNLANLPMVVVAHADGLSYDFGLSDIIFVNAGATCIQKQWLEKLRKGGRLIVPLTISNLERKEVIGTGKVLRVFKKDNDFDAEFIEDVKVYPCIGAREDNERLKKAVSQYGWDAKRLFQLLRS